MRSSRSSGWAVSRVAGRSVAVLAAVFFSVGVSESEPRDSTAATDEGVAPSIHSGHSHSDHSHHDQTGPPRPNRPTHTHPRAIILTPGRSGSSFVASWLAKGVSDDVIYLLEPCSNGYHNVHTSATPEADLSGTACAELIDELLQCNFTRTKVGRQSLTHDGFDMSFGNISDTTGCGSDGRLVVVKETRLGAPILKRLLGDSTTANGGGRARARADGGPETDTDTDHATASTPVWHGSPPPPIISIDRDPRAVLASRKVVWPGWAVAVGASVDRLRPTSPESLTPGHAVDTWPAWLAEAVAEVETNPFVILTQRGHPYSQSIRGLCIEMLAVRKLATQLAGDNAEKDGGADTPTDRQAAQPRQRMLHLSYERDVLQKPRATAERLLRFVGLGGEKQISAVARFVDTYTSGKCGADSADLAFSTCRSHAQQGISTKVDDKWKAELEPWELHLIHREPPCRQLILAQGHGLPAEAWSAPIDASVVGHRTALEAEATAWAAAALQAAALTGAEVQVTFSAGASPTAVAPQFFALYYVTRHPRSVGQRASVLPKINTQTLVGEFDTTTDGALRSNTYHGHEFIVTEARREGAPMLHRWVANITDGAAQTVALDFVALAALATLDAAAPSDGSGRTDL